MLRPVRLSGTEKQHAALQALAQHYGDDPDTGALLRARTVTDPDKYPRSAALEALARHYRDDLKTRTLLRGRAVTDPGVDPTFAL